MIRGNADDYRKLFGFICYYYSHQGKNMEDLKNDMTASNRNDTVLDSLLRKLQQSGATMTVHQKYHKYKKKYLELKKRMNK